MKKAVETGGLDLFICSAILILVVVAECAFFSLSCRDELSASIDLKKQVQQEMVIYRNLHDQLNMRFEQDAQLRLEQREASHAEGARIIQQIDAMEQALQDITRAVNEQRREMRGRKWRP